MLYEALLDEETDTMHNTLNIVDMAPADFEHLIKYIYLGKASFCSIQELCFALYAAERFQLDDLQIQCLKRLQRRIEEDHVAAAELIDARLKFTILCDNEHIFTKVIKIVKSKYEDILTSDRICAISKDTMQLLLHLEPDRDVKEIVVFIALLRWGEAFCNRNDLPINNDNLQAAVGDLVTAVQYNLIPFDLIDSAVVPSGLLNDRLLLFAFRRAAGGNVDDTQFGKDPTKLESLLQQVRQLQIHSVKCFVLNWSECVHPGNTYRNGDEQRRNNDRFGVYQNRYIGNKIFNII